jgi:hypothetical protein
MMESRNWLGEPILTMNLAPTAVRSGVCAPMGSGLVKGHGRTGLWLMADGGTGLWEKARTGVRSWLACTHSGPECGIRMTVRPDPGWSVRSAAVLQAHAQTRARPVLAFSGGFCWASSWVRM